LDEILAVIEEDGINIEYMYGFTFGLEKKAALIFRFEQADQAISTLQSNGINVVGSVELFAHDEV
jgi:hypothetical protein